MSCHAQNVSCERFVRQLPAHRFRGEEKNGAPCGEGADGACVRSFVLVDWSRWQTGAGIRAYEERRLAQGSDHVSDRNICRLRRSSTYVAGPCRNPGIQPAVSPLQLVAHSPRSHEPQAVCKCSAVWRGCLGGARSSDADGAIVLSPPVGAKYGDHAGGVLLAACSVVACLGSDRCTFCMAADGGVPSGVRLVSCDPPVADLPQGEAVGAGGISPGALTGGMPGLW